MDPTQRMFDQVYNNLGEDFRTHLKNGDLHLYKTNDRGELIRKSSKNIVWIHLTPGSSVKASTDTAKEMISMKINDLTGSNYSLTSSNVKTTNDNFDTITALFMFAKIAAAEDGRSLSLHINNYDIHNPDQLYELAKIAAAQNGMATLELLDNYGIKNPNQIKEIIKIALIQNPMAIATNIPAFRQLDPMQRFEIAKTIAAINPMAVSTIIDKYDFPENERYQIAHIVVAKDPSLISQYISNYNLNENQRVTLAKIIAAKDGKSISEHIIKFNIMDPVERFNIALLIASSQNKNQNSYLEDISDYEPEVIQDVISEHILKFNLNPEHKLEIAIMILKQKTIPPHELIILHDIKDQSHKFEIAKIAATQNAFEISEHIASYDLTESMRFEILKIAIARASTSVVMHLSNYKINDTALLLEVAKLCIKVNAMAFYQHIENFKITDSAQLFELIKIGAQNDGYNTASFITKFNLNPNQTYEIAKLAAAQNGERISEFINNFNIRDQAQRFAIAKIAAAQSGIGISKFIINYNLNADQRYEIAKIAAAQSGRISQYIDKYNLNPSQLYEIAKIAAAQDGKAVSEFIANYNISDPLHRFEIAKIAVAQGRSEAFYLLDNFSLIDIQDHRLELLNISLKHLIASKKFTELQCILNKHLGNGLYEKGLFQDYHGLNLVTELELTNSEIEQFAKKSPYYNVLSPLVEEICSQKDPFVKKPLVQYLGSFLLLCQVQNIPIENVKMAFPIISELSSLREPDFRLILLNSVVTHLKSEKSLNSWKKLFNLADNKSFTALNCMFLSTLIPENLLLVPENLLLVNEVMTFVKNRDFQVGTQRLPFIRNLEKITNEKRYSLEDKQSIFQNIILKKPLTLSSFIKNIQNVAIIMAFEEDEILKSAHPTQNLNLIIDRIFSKRFGLESIENFEEKFRNTFGATSEPDAIFRYSATLLKLPPSSQREELMNCLKEYAISILEGKFVEMRYATENNIHLQTVFNSLGPELKKEWQKGAKYPNLFTSENVTPQQEKTFNALDSFRTTIINDHSLSQDELPELFAVLATSDLQKRDEVKKSLENKLKKMDEGFQGKFSVSNSELKALKSMCSNMLLTNNEIDAKIDELGNDITKIINSKAHEINNTRLEMLHLMYPNESFPSADKLVEKLGHLSQALKRENALRIKKLNSFQLQLINLTDPRLSLTNDEKISKLNTALKTLNALYPQKTKDPQTEVDPKVLSDYLEKTIESLQTKSTRQVSKYEGWTVIDTDDPLILLMLGTAVPGKSCQDIDGNPELSKCLLAYLNDGKNRALVVNDMEGKMAARAIFRLLWDDSANKAVLFMERIYPSPVDAAIEKALNNAAQQRAQALGLTLLKATFEIEGQQYPNTVGSLDGRVPFEYVDAGRGVEEKIWNLENTYVA